MGIFSFLGGQPPQSSALGGGYAAQPPMQAPPRIPWGSNPMVTMAGLSMLGAPTLGAGLRNVGANAGVGMAAKVGMQDRMMQAQDRAGETAAWTAALKKKSGIPTTPEDDAALAKFPEIALKIMPEPVEWTSLVDPAARLAAGIPAKDTRPVQYNKATGELKFPGGASTTIDNRQVGSPQPGFKFNYDDNGNVLSQEPIPNSDADLDRKAADEAEVNKRANQVQKADVVVEDLDRAMAVVERSPFWTTGIGGSIAGQFSGTGSTDVAKLVDSVKANIGFEQLNQMRSESTTGAALGSVQVVELQFLQSVLGSLEQSQSADQLQYNMKRLKNSYLDIIHGPGKGPPREIVDERREADPSIPDGIDPEDWKFMSPEQKKLFSDG